MLRLPVCARVNMCASVKMAQRNTITFQMWEKLIAKRRSGHGEKGCWGGGRRGRRGGGGGGGGDEQLNLSNPFVEED